MTMRVWLRRRPGHGFSGASTCRAASHWASLRVNTVYPEYAESKCIIRPCFLRPQHIVEDDVANGPQHVVIGEFLECLAVEFLDAGKAVDTIVEALGTLERNSRAPVDVLGLSGVPVPPHTFFAEA
jgi:hypothetical protein